MTRTFRFFASSWLLLAAGCDPAADSGGAASDQPAALPSTVTSQDFGAYELHFNAQETNRLTTEIALEHGITRSASRGMLTVSVLRKREGAVPMPVAADVTVSAVNLSDQYRALSPRAIREADALYYIAETPISDGETLIFTINAIPENETAPLTVRFMRRFFVD